MVITRQVYDAWKKRFTKEWDNTGLERWVVDGVEVTKEEFEVATFKGAVVDGGGYARSSADSIIFDDDSTQVVWGGWGGGGNPVWTVGAATSATVDPGGGGGGIVVYPDVSPGPQSRVKYRGANCGSCERDEVEEVYREYDDDHYEITVLMVCNSCSHERLDVYRFHHYE